MPDRDPFQIAALRACSSFGDDAWNSLEAAERSFAICRELRRLDAEQIASRAQPGPGPARRGNASTSRALPQATDRDRFPRRLARQEASDLPVAASRDTKSYRIVVRPNQSGPKSYRWEIVNDTNDVVLSRSPGRYKTMEQAYHCGVAELAACSRGPATLRRR